MERIEQIGRMSEWMGAGEIINKYFTISCKFIYLALMILLYYNVLRPPAIDFSFIYLYKFNVFL